MNNVQGVLVRSEMILAACSDMNHEAPIVGGPHDVGEEMPLPHSEQ